MVSGKVRGGGQSAEPAPAFPQDRDHGLKKKKKQGFRGGRAGRAFWAHDVNRFDHGLMNRKYPIFFWIASGCIIRLTE